MYYTMTCPSPLGTLTLAADGGGHLTGLWMEGQKYFGGAASEAMEEKSDVPALHAAREWLERYFAGERPALSGLPLCPAGGEFRQEVWRILCEIPYGEVVTYGDIARQVAAKRGLPSMSGQAVGGAVGHNPISIIIPCHRVVGAGGSLTGYAGGVARKVKLLELEGADMTRLHVPKRGSAL